MWIHRDWKTPLGEPVKNRELIESIGKRIDELKVKFVKVQAHAGDYFNSVVDSMASGLTRSMVSDHSIKDGVYAI
jgi:ribonuclease HI